MSQTAQPQTSEEPRRIPLGSRDRTQTAVTIARVVGEDAQTLPVAAFQSFID